MSVREIATSLVCPCQQRAQAQDVTEALKAADQMAWVGRMNNIRASAMEIAGKELIYA